MHVKACLVMLLRCVLVCVLGEGKVTIAIVCCVTMEFFLVKKHSRNQGLSLGENVSPLSIPRCSEVLDSSVFCVIDFLGRNA